MKRLIPFLLLTAAVLPAQTSLPLSFRVQVSGAVQTVADNGTIQFNAEAIGKPLDASVSVTNRGTGTINITRVEITGITDFTVTGAPAPEVNYLPNESFSVNVRFQPTTGQRAVGAIRFFYTDTPPPVPAGGRITSNSSGLNLNGVAPDYTFTYLPPPPTTIDPNRELRFAVRYAPTAIESSTGSVRIELVDRAVTFNVTGSSTGPVYSYELLNGTSATALARGATVPVPDNPP